MECAFCTDTQVKKRLILENELAIAFPTHTPIVPGHILICPKRHVQYLEQATTEEREAIEDLRNKIKGALKSVFNARGFNYAWNEEKIGGQSVPHFHLHIVPRTENDAGVYQYEPREFLYRRGPRTATTPQEELTQIVELVRKAL